jgi:SAM-dependent methyltransferase
VQRFMPLLAPPPARVLDLACGSGRHLRWLLAGGWTVTGVDRDTAALAALQAALRPAASAQATLIDADLEQGPWPLQGQTFDALMATNYLWRPRWPELRALLAPGGLLLVETFAHGQQTIGRPSRPEFLLQPGELLALAAGLRVVAFEDGFEPAGPAGPPRFVQRIAAVREAAHDGQPPRHRLAGEAAGAVGAEGAEGAAG